MILLYKTKDHLLLLDLISKSLGRVTIVLTRSTFGFLRGIVISDLNIG